MALIVFILIIAVPYWIIQADEKDIREKAETKMNEKKRVEYEARIDLFDKLWRKGHYEKMVQEGFLAYCEPSEAEIVTQIQEYVEEPDTQLNLFTQTPMNITGKVVTKYYEFIGI